MPAKGANSTVKNPAVREKAEISFKRYIQNFWVISFHKYMWEINLTNILSNMVDWYHRCILSKYCKIGICKEEKSKSKSISRTSLKHLSLHMRTRKFFEVCRRQDIGICWALYFTTPSLFYQKNLNPPFPGNLENSNLPTPF